MDSHELKSAQNGLAQAESEIKLVKK